MRYADPTRCPDCRAVLPADPVSCPTCRLPLRAPAAHLLFATLSSADELLAALRDDVLPATTVAAPAGRPPGDARHGLRGTSVPRIMLGLGAACLLVAAVTFLAVTWSWLGVAGRTAVLVALTASAVAATLVLLSRGLRVAAEALGTVSLGLVALDVVGARSSGWLGVLGGGDGGTAAVAGGAVLVAALTLTLVARRRRLRAPLATQIGAALGLLVAAAGVAVATDHPSATASVAVLAAAVLTAGARRAGLEPLSDAAAVVGATWWLGLLTVGLATAADSPSWAGLVTGADGAGLASAALLALLPLGPLTAPVVRGSRPVVLASVGTAATLLSLLAALPLADEGPVAVLVGCLAGLGAWTALTVVLPRWWSPLTAGPQVLLALPSLGVVLDVALSGLTALVAVDAPAGVGTSLSAAPTIVPAALLPLTVLLAALALAGHLPDPARRRGVLVAVGTLAPAGALALATAPVPLALVVAVLVLPAAAAVTTVSARWSVPVSAAAGLLAAAGVAAALPSAALTGLALVPVVAVLAAHLRPGRAAVTGPLVDRAAATLLPPALGLLVVSTATVAGVEVADRALPVLAALGALVLLTLVTRPRAWLEVSAATVAAVATAAVVDTATGLALHLTLAGALVSTSALLHPARRPLAAPGALLLAAATWVRLADLGVTTPEAYTLPGALLLLGAGLLHLRLSPGAGTRAALLPGLGLAVVPSLLVVLGEPAGQVALRALLLGGASLVLVLGGARLRWSAPVLVGAGAMAVLLSAELAPYASEVPRWLLIGAAGLALTASGATWERRAADARRAARYLVRLR